MHFHSFCLILSSLSVFPLSGAIKHRKPSAVLEKQNTPRQWSKGARVQADVVLPVRIALAGTNIERGEDFLMQLSDPSSPYFAQHWPLAQIVDTFAPSQETVNMTKQWLADSGIDLQRIHQSANRGFLIFNASAGELEHLLQAEYFHYDHTTKGHSAIACEKYHVPIHLHSHIDYITPGVSLRSFIKRSKPTRIQKRAESHSTNNATSGNCTGIPGQSGIPPSSLTQFNLATNLSICNNYVTPACIHALYGVPTNITTNPYNSMAIFEFTASYIQSDMDLYFQYVATNVPATTQPIKMLINGAQITPNFNPQQEFVSEEANLDFQVSWPLVYPLNISLLDSLPTTAQNSSIKQQDATLNLEQQLFYALQDAFAAIDGSLCTGNSGPQCHTFEPPNVISFSYGTDELALSPRETNRLCNEFLKLGLQGTTLVFSTGDSGVEGQTGQCIGPRNQTFNTGSLVSCPWALSIGATMIGENSTVRDPEVAAYVDFGAGGTFTSGGGFSLYHSAPKYQQDALDTYFNAHNPGHPTFYYTGNASVGADGGRYNRNGRGYPDIAANGVNLLNVDNGCAVQQFGTSAAAPIVASMVTLINNVRLNAGKRPVGFVNPTLYANPSIFNDIIEGHNEGCGTQGFEAVRGWDPVTGLGTINFPKLLEVFMALP